MGHIYNRSRSHLIIYQMVSFLLIRKIYDLSINHNITVYKRIQMHAKYRLNYIKMLMHDLT